MLFSNLRSVEALVSVTHLPRGRMQCWDLSQVIVDIDIFVA